MNNEETPINRASNESEFRYDPIADRWTLIAEGRENRPSSVEPNCVCARNEDDERAENVARDCAFCPGAEAQTTATIEMFALKEGRERLERPLNVDDFELLAEPDEAETKRRYWVLRVVENKYPAFRFRPGDFADRDAFARFADEFADGGDRFAILTPRFHAVGRHEVIIDSREHKRGWADFSDLEIRLTFRAFRSRLNALRRSDSFGYAFAFKNVGEKAGASQAHTHCQLTANVATPPDVRAQFKRLARYERARKEKGETRSYWTALVNAELENGARIVRETERFILYCPFASRFPMQTEICPRFDRAFEDYDDSTLDELAILARDAVAILERAKALRDRARNCGDPLERLDYNAILRNVPYRLDDATQVAPEFPRPRWTFIPSLVKKAGYELGCDLDINPVAPETAAARLREADR